MPGSGYSKRYVYSTVIELANLSGSRIFERAETRIIRSLYHRITIDNNSPLNPQELAVMRVLRNKHLGHPESAKWRNRNKKLTPDEEYLKDLRTLVRSSTISGDTKEKIKTEINNQKSKQIETFRKERIQRGVVSPIPE